MGKCVVHGEDPGIPALMPSSHPSETLLPTVAVGYVGVTSSDSHAELLTLYSPGKCLLSLPTVCDILFRLWGRSRESSALPLGRSQAVPWARVMVANEDASQGRGTQLWHVTRAGWQPV